MATMWPTLFPNPLTDAMLTTTCTAGSDSTAAASKGDLSTIASKSDLNTIASQGDLSRSPTSTSDITLVEKFIVIPSRLPVDKLKAFRVDWLPNEAANPRNWTKCYKIWVVFQLGMLALCASLPSSITATSEPEYLGVSMEVSVLTVALYVLGFAIGPSIWAPISEVYGRRWSMLPAVFILGLFSIGTAVSKNATSVFVTRFLAGVFGSAPVSNVSAALSDMYAPVERALPVSFYVICVFGGPSIGPIIGAALESNPHLGWRWTEYISALVVFVVFIATFFLLPETFEPALLKKQAQQLRERSGDSRIWHPHEDERINIHNIFTKHLSRPLLMLFTDPMVACSVLYASFTYGLVYMSLEVVPIVFRDIRGYGLVESSLPFLGLFIGVCLALAINLAANPRYRRIVEQNEGKPVPEARFPPCIIGGILLAIGLFWFGWTADPRFHWIVPTVALGFIGAGFIVIFQQCINFLLDTYAFYAASAVSANTIVRSLLACGLPMAARPMYNRLGVGPATSVLGCIACLLLPIPLLFMRYGKRFRRASIFVPED